MKVNDVLIKNIYDTICYGQTYSKYNFTATESGVYKDSLQSVSGCDSIIILYLTVNPANIDKSSSDTVGICQGETYIFADKTLTTSGYYEQTLQNIYGCDSIISITLVVNPVYWVTDSVTIKNGQKYTFNGKKYSQTGNYIDTLVSSFGCDSIVTLCLTVQSSLSDINKSKKIIVYPNPVDKNSSIAIESEDFISTILLSDMQGKKIKEIEINSLSKKTEIDIADLDKGIYILRIKTDKFCFIEQLIVF